LVLNDSTEKGTLGCENNVRIQLVQYSWASASQVWHLQFTSKLLALSKEPQTYLR